ncbi:hypothetical protein Zmor_001037 [Zophobas morio]|uniref:Uncharacterized protein n=1 Tax=Zophobas morio TaxID=2755281 RepID=A0AA38J4D9_9CUCU|nr:hypothetical protein Zmor_001037 [Zophobas morio]
MNRNWRSSSEGYAVKAEYRLFIWDIYRPGFPRIYLVDGMCRVSRTKLQINLTPPRHLCLRPAGKPAGTAAPAG